MSDLKTQVYLLAENRLLREALGRILGKKADIRVVGAAALNPQTLEDIVKLVPDVLLSDSAAMVPSNGPVISRLRGELPGLRVLMIGMEPDPQSLLQSIGEGALGYVLKDASANEVYSAVRAVINHEAVCPTSLLTILFETVAQFEAPRAVVARERRLSRRQQQLIRLINQGLTDKEIASQLNIAEQTVRNHVHRMLRKVGASDRLMIGEHVRQFQQYRQTASRLP